MGTWIEIFTDPEVDDNAPASFPAMGTWIEIACGLRADSRIGMVVPCNGNVD